jgi:hypothetical protein
MPQRLERLHPKAIAMLRLELVQGVCLAQRRGHPIFACEESFGQQPVRSRKRRDERPRLFALPTALDFFAESAHVVKGSARCFLSRRWDRHAVGIDALGRRRLILQRRGGFFLELPESLSVDISTERACVDAPFPRRSAALIERNASGFGVGIFGHQKYTLGIRPAQDK